MIPIMVHGGTLTDGSEVLEEGWSDSAESMMGMANTCEPQTRNQAWFGEVGSLLKVMDSELAGDPAEPSLRNLINSKTAVHATQSLFRYVTVYVHILETTVDCRAVELTPSGYS